FFHNKKNELEGIDITIANEIAHALGVKLEINSQAPSFNAVVDQVENDAADIGLGSLSSTLTRGLHVSFSTPYLKVNKVLIVNRVTDLKLESEGTMPKGDQIKFGVIKNSAYESFLKEKFYTISKYASPNNVVSYGTLEAAMKELMDGKIYALFTDEIRANYLLKNVKSANIYSKKYMVDNQDDPLCLAVNFKNPTLLGWINLFVASMDDSGMANAIFQQYLKGLK
ncbi:MAG: transporter substrate-binding domain-containing protein, partial [Bdellovibrionota bacterium]